MDYRCTEAFAREMEAAALRAEGLRREAVDAFWAAVGRGVRSIWRALARRVAGARIQSLYPEA